MSGEAAETAVFQCGPTLTYRPALDGERIDSNGLLIWNGGSARYLYVLEVGSMNPGLPPNLDLPEATLWHADVFFDVPAFESGVAYGALPNSKAPFSARQHRELQRSCVRAGNTIWKYCAISLSLSLAVYYRGLSPTNCQVRVSHSRIFCAVSGSALGLIFM